MSQTISRLPEGGLNHLQKKILYTLGFLLIYRVGVHIPIPGVDTPALSEFFRTQAGLIERGLVGRGLVGRQLRLLLSDPEGREEEHREAQHREFQKVGHVDLHWYLVLP